MYEHKESLKCAECENEFLENHLAYQCIQTEKYYCFKCFKKNDFERDKEKYDRYVVTKNELVPLKCADNENTDDEKGKCTIDENHLVYQCGNINEYYCFNCFKKNHFKTYGGDYQLYIVTKSELVLLINYDDVIEKVIKKR